MKRHVKLVLVFKFSELCIATYINAAGEPDKLVFSAGRMGKIGSKWYIEELNGDEMR